MEHKERIQITDTFQDIAVKMSAGNPGALNVIINIVKDSEKIDPDAAFGPFAHILSLDSYGIYAERIWMLYKDVCKQNLIKMLAVLRSVQLGKTSISVLNHAIDNYGEGIDVEDCFNKVKAELPNFAKGN